MKNYGEQRDRTRKYAPLTKEQQKLVQENMWVAESIGYKYAQKVVKGSVLSKEDLVGVGYMALCAAVGNYKSSVGKFSTYSWLFVEGWIRHAIRDISRTVRLPRNVESNRGRVKRLLREEGLTYAEVAAAMGISEGLVAECEKSWREENAELTGIYDYEYHQSTYGEFSERCQKVVEGLSDKEIALVQRYLRDPEGLGDKDRFKAQGIVEEIQYN